MNCKVWRCLQKLFVLVLMSLHFVFGCCQSQGNTEDDYWTEEEYLQLKEPEQVSQIMDEIFQNYDKLKRPYYRVKAVEIGILMGIQAISHVSEENMEFQATVYFTHIWEDPRVAFDKDNNDSFLILRGEHLNKLWLPDTYILNARKVSIEANTYSAKVYANGTINYSYRLSTIALAKMNFLNYPMDNQILNIDIYSYSYTADQLTLRWKKGSMVHNEMAGYVVKSENKISEIHTDGIEDWSFLSFSITVRRRLGYFIMQFFFPCILCAVVSWLPFWMDRYEIGDRMALSITTLLTEVFLSQYINSNMPRVSYIKAADEYLLATFIFIFMGLLENVVVYNFRSDFELQDIYCYGQEISPSQEIMTESPRNNLEEEASSKSADHNGNKMDAEETTEKDQSLVVDKISRVLFPLAFIVFQAYYFGRHL
uniref:Gamma-aminobutyric acid receptor subunit rho-1-like n=1 Tax=Actinia tenebrosa TaxID=6105 RepID=A0A6P8I0N4_ACTTE